MSTASVPVRIAETQMQEMSKKLTLKDFNTDVHIICEDGSTFYIAGACLAEWSNDYGTWVFVFCEHYPDMVFDKEDLYGYRVVKDARD